MKTVSLKIDEELYTIFWINELYNPDDADTYFVEVLREEPSVK